MSDNQTVFGKNEIIFTLLRYLIYGLQTARGFILAYFLGPYFLGIYGYLMLYQQYLSYTNLGINYSVNSELALLNSSDLVERKKIIDSAFSMVLFISLGIIIIGSVTFCLKIPLFPFQNSYNYAFVMVALTVLTHVQQVFVNIFRINKNLKPIIIGELLVSLGLLITVLFFKGIHLVNAVFYVWVFLLFFVVVLYRIIYGNKITFNTSRIKLLLKSGFPLLIYAFSYYLMNLMVRTLIGAFYPVEVMGYFSFANNITTAIMLGLDTITWIIFPAIIAKLASDKLNNEELSNYLITFTNKLLVLVLLIVSVSIISLPVLFYILPKYRPIEFSLIILLINQIVFNTGFAFVSLSIARKMHKQMAFISLLSVAISTVFSVIFCYYKLPYIWLVVTNVLGSLCFINILIYYISRKFDLSYHTLKKSFDWPMQAVFVLIVITAVFGQYWLIIGLLGVVFLLRLKSLKELYSQLGILFIKRKI